MTTYRRLAVVANLFSLMMVTVVPLANGAREYDPKVLLDWIETTAVVWASVIAAETLAEMERARRVELTPVFDISLRRGFVNGEPCLWLYISNLGKGAAAGLQAWAISAPNGNEDTGVETIDGLSTVFLPLHEEKHRLNTYWTSIALGQSSKCDLIVRAQYRDALGEKKVIRAGFAIGSLTAEIRKLDAPAELSVAERKLSAQTE